MSGFSSPAGADRGKRGDKRKVIGAGRTGVDAEGPAASAGGVVVAGEVRECQADRRRTVWRVETVDLYVDALSKHCDISPCAPSVVGQLAGLFAGRWGHVTVGAGPGVSAEPQVKLPGRPIRAARLSALLPGLPLPVSGGMAAQARVGGWCGPVEGVRALGRAGSGQRGGRPGGGITPMAFEAARAAYPPEVEVLDLAGGRVHGSQLEVGEALGMGGVLPLLVNLAVTASASVGGGERGGGASRVTGHATGHQRDTELRLRGFSV